MQQSARATDMMVGDATSEMVRNRLVGWTSIRALWALPLPLRSLSPRDVAAPRRLLVSARSARLRAPPTCMIRSYDDSIKADRAAVDHDPDALRRRVGGA